MTTLLPLSGDFAQTFFVGSDAVAGSKFVYIKKIDLFFKDKPSITPGSSVRPGCTMYLCETVNNQNLSVPKLDKAIKYGTVRKEYGSINISSNASSETTFEFRVPVPIETDKAYAIVIKFDSPGLGNSFSLWRNKAGETYNSKQSSPVTKGALDGQFFVITNDNNLTPSVDTDLMFTVYAQKFTTNETTFQAVNRSFEFLSLFKGETSGKFVGGEAVFANTGYVSSQTVSVSSSSANVTGTGTAFNSTYTVGDNIIINSGSANSIRKITNIANSTTLTLENPPAFTNASANYIIAPVAVVYDYNQLAGSIVLVGSTANNSKNFIPNTTTNTIVGEITGAYGKVFGVENLPMSSIEPDFKIISPTLTTSNLSIKVSNSSYTTANSNIEVKLYNKTELTNQRVFLSSRSNEVTNSANLVNGKSLNINLTFDTSNEFVSPILDEEDMGFGVHSVYLNSDLTNEEIPVIGKAQSKYVSKPVLLSTNTECSSLKVTLNAYRPARTNVHVYCKIKHKDDPTSVEDIAWTKLHCTTPATLSSSETNKNDIIELNYEVYRYPIIATDSTTSGILIPGNFLINLEEEETSRTFFSNEFNLKTYLNTSSYVRIFNQAFPLDSIVAPVANLQDDSFKLSKLIDYNIDRNSGIPNEKYSIFTQGGLKVESVSNFNAAFSDFTNDNTVSYYGFNRQYFSGFHTFQVKIVFTSNDTANYPYVDSIIANAFSNF